ncbi:MAG TPA: VirB8/TrbF family protein [Bryobacteraceae bacterium]|jgi:type IV secretion system protein VirB5
MSTMHLKLPSPRDFDPARRQFVELYGSTAVMNTYLKIAVLSLCAVSIALAFAVIYAYDAARHVKPLVIRINDVGRAEAVSYAAFEYHPQEAEIKYFLIQFVEGRYSRMRATVQESYARSLYFLDGKLAAALIAVDKKAKPIEQFLANPAEEIEVQVTNVSIEDLRTPPYKATVDFEKVYYAAVDHSETRREKCVAHIVFTVRDRVPNAMIPVNPLGLTITYFREDQAFQ